MQLESLKDLVMQQALEKGFGVKPEDLGTPDKTVENFALIHSEITEAYRAYLAKRMEGEDSFYEELGNALQRTFDLEESYDICFGEPIDCSNLSNLSIEGQLLALHKIASEAYENYRHKKDDEFKIGLLGLAYAIITVSGNDDFALENAVKRKKTEDVGIPTKPAEKFALIHSEITEAYQAFLACQMEGKDGFYEELGDVLQRTLHLGGIYGVSFQAPVNFSIISSLEIEGKLLTLHDITSETYECFRQGKDGEFRFGLRKLAYAVLQVSNDYNFSLEDAVNQKIERNLGRKWDPAQYRETFSATDQKKGPG